MALYHHIPPDILIPQNVFFHICHSLVTPQIDPYGSPIFAGPGTYHLVLRAIIGNLRMLGAHPYRALHHLAKKYGPIMSLRLGSVLTIVVPSPHAAELFLKTHDGHFTSRLRVQAADRDPFLWSQGHGSDRVWAILTKC